MIPYNTAVEAVLDYLEPFGAFDLASKQISPARGQYPSPDVEAIYGANIGIGLSPIPNSKDWAGTVLFTVQIPVNGKIEAFYKCRVHVSISTALSSVINAGMSHFEGHYNHKDAAIRDGVLQVRTSSEGKRNLCLTDCDFALVPAWEPKFIEITSVNRNPVWALDNGKLRVRGGEPENKIVTYLWGDNDIYDQGISIPKNGVIDYYGEKGETLTDLFILLLKDPHFMRVSKQMDEQIFSHRVAELEALFAEEVTEYRDDFELLSEAIIHEVWTQHVQPPTKAPKIQAPTQPQFKIKLQQ